MLKNISRSLRDLLGSDYMEAVKSVAVNINGMSEAEAAALIDEKIEFVPADYIERMDAMAQKTGETVVLLLAMHKLVLQPRLTEKLLIQTQHQLAALAVQELVKMAEHISLQNLNTIILHSVITSRAINSLPMQESLAF